MEFHLTALECHLPYGITGLKMAALALASVVWALALASALKAFALAFIGLDCKAKAGKRVTLTKP